RVKVAVKLLRVRRSELDAADLADLRERVATAARIHHPHLARLQGLGSDQGSPYLVRDYAPGVSLPDCLPPPAKAPDIPPPIALISKVASGLAALHEAGLIHGSIRPGNILIDSASEPHLTDPDPLHHLAPRMNSASVSGKCMLVGPGAGLAYRAPEQRSHRGE